MIYVIRNYFHRCSTTLNVTKNSLVDSCTLIVIFLLANTNKTPWDDDEDDEIQCDYVKS